MSLSDFKRSDRIAELIQSEVALLIQQKLRDPRLPSFVSISAVSVSPDLRHAKIYFTAISKISHTALTSEEREAAVKHLNTTTSFLRQNLAKSLKLLRIVPRLHFVYDDSIEHSRYLRGLIDNANRDIVSEDRTIPNDKEEGDDNSSSEQSSGQA